MIGIYHQRRSGHTNMTMYNTSALTLPREDILPESIDCVFIDAAKHEYHTYLERLLPLCSAHAHIICDDVGDYADKVAPIYNSLRHHGLHRTTHALADGDTILHIHLTPDLH